MGIEPIPVAGGLAAGVAMGLAYFAGLWWTVQRLPGARRPVLVWGTSAVVRVAVATGVFYLLLTWGAAQLVAGVLGFIGARVLATRIWGPCREPGVPTPEGDD
ncbi:MAG: ATP synthase subunit I [Armatimonadota bacterium]|nr:ATP synthase subunit I [Armatimonadota bacterium]